MVGGESIDQRPIAERACDPMWGHLHSSQPALSRPPPPPHNLPTDPNQFVAAHAQPLPHAQQLRCKRTITKLR